MRILICASEIVPFAKTGGLADVAGALPRALVELGHDVRVALPNYAAVDQKKARPEPAGEVRVPVGEETVSVEVLLSRAVPGVPAYLVEAPEYFHRKALYGEPDDAVRFAVFCRALLEFLRRDAWRPKVIHCSDWQTALIPTYLRQDYAADPRLNQIATLFTIHNFAYQGLFNREVMEEIGLSAGLFTPDGVEFYGQLNLMKAGLRYSDLLSTVSPTYAKEMQTAEFGERLEGVLAGRTQDLFGVLNGIDYDEWSPATDPHLAARYDVHTLAGKAKCKADLQRRLKLPEASGVPLFGLVSRLASQKGLDLLAEALPRLLRLDVQFALLGSGDAVYQDLMVELAKEHPKKMATVTGFDDPLAHRIYAGVDFFVMPSHYEPCGLGQLISLRYGTIPIVRRTGGLADTIEDFDERTGEGNGFSFEERSPLALLGTCCRAMMVRSDAGLWPQLVRNAMAGDFSWDRSAQEYVRLYELARARHGS